MLEQIRYKGNLGMLCHNIVLYHLRKVSFFIIKTRYQGEMMSGFEHLYMGRSPCEDANTTSKLLSSDHRHLSLLFCGLLVSRSQSSSTDLVAN
jgi:hypothetical protein